MESPQVLNGLRGACGDPSLLSTDPDRISLLFRSVIGGSARHGAGMAFWRKGLLAAMHLNANLPATYFRVPAAQVMEVGMQVKI
jgi:KUP system potassium uptake protein